MRDTRRGEKHLGELSGMLRGMHTARQPIAPARAQRLLQRHTDRLQVRRLPDPRRRRRRRHPQARLVSEGALGGRGDDALQLPMQVAHLAHRFVVKRVRLAKLRLRDDDAHAPRRHMALIRPMYDSSGETLVQRVATCYFIEACGTSRHGRKLLARDRICSQVPWYHP